jgi:hypothetical protein
MKQEDIILGFGEPPIPSYIYVGDSGDPNAPWYEVDYKNDKKIPILQTALTGKFIGLNMVKKETKKGDKVKLDISIQADKLYVIRSGVDTYFSRSFLLAAEKIDIFEELITLVARKGDDQSVVFCSIYYAINKEKIKADWDDKIKLLPKINALQVRLNIHPQTYDEVMSGQVHTDADDVNESTPTITSVPIPEPEPSVEKTVEPAPPEPKVEQSPKQEPPKQAPPPEAKVEVPASEREAAPIALAKRTMAPDFYATEIDDLITLKQFGQLRPLVEQLGKTEDEFCAEIMGCQASDLSIKGAEHIIHFAEVKIKESKKTKK